MLCLFFIITPTRRKYISIVVLRPKWPVGCTLYMSIESVLWVMLIADCSLESKYPAWPPATLIRRCMYVSRTILSTKKKCLAKQSTHSLTHSLAHSLTPPNTNSFGHSFVDWLTDWMIHSLIHLLTHSLTHSMIYCISCPTDTPPYCPDKHSSTTNNAFFSHSSATIILVCWWNA